MYATVNDLKNRLPESELAQLLSMHENGEQAAELALADASAQINSYLAVRYQTPVVLPNGAMGEYLKAVAVNIARYRLYIVDATDEVEKRYKEMIDWLKDVAAGRADITFAIPIKPDEKKGVLVASVNPAHAHYGGQVFGDAVFARMPGVGGF